MEMKGKEIKVETESNILDSATVFMMAADTIAITNTQRKETSIERPRIVPEQPGVPVSFGEFDGGDMSFYQGLKGGRGGRRRGHRGDAAINSPLGLLRIGCQA